MTWLRALWRRLVLLIFWKRNNLGTVPEETTGDDLGDVVPEVEPGEGQRFGPNEAIRSPTDIRPPETSAELSPVAEAAIEAAIPIGEPPPLPPIFVLPPHRKEKWVTPKGDTAPPSPSRERKPRTEPTGPPKPKRERIQLTEDPEQWGQYYFRDAILDQLGRFWVYLKRMKRGDRDAYDLLHQVGIQMVPWTATHGFDKWREDSAEVELSPWWCEHRPSFGAIAYGFDDLSDMEDHTYIADGANDQGRSEGSYWKPVEKRLRAEGVMGKRPIFITKSTYKYDKKTEDKPMAIWTPRFLYFQKYSKPPPEFEYATDGDTYGMVVYWDRADKGIPKWWRSKKHGGAPQEYGVCVEHKTGRVRVLRMKIRQRVEIKWAKGPYGGKCTQPTVFTHTHWDVADRYLYWANRDLSRIEPEDYLRRLFIQAASMYESAVLGSMVRIAVKKGDLIATFGVEIKRMAHFFKDRDVKLTVKGRPRPVVHVVRPHIRHTKHGDVPIKMHFSGMREFTWANYEVSVTIPGRDHFLLPEYDVGAIDGRFRERGQRYLNQEKIGQLLTERMKQGLGKHQR